MISLQRLIARWLRENTALVTQVIYEHGSECILLFGSQDGDVPRALPIASISVDGCSISWPPMRIPAFCKNHRFMITHPRFFEWLERAIQVVIKHLSTEYVLSKKCNR